MLFFLDGDHSYDSVFRELNIIFSHIENPVVLIHDSFYQSEISNYNVGPFMAIKDALKSISIEKKRIDTSTGLPGMTSVY